MCAYIAYYYILYEYYMLFYIMHFIHYRNKIFETAHLAQGDLELSVYLKVTLAF